MSGAERSSGHTGVHLSSLQLSVYLDGETPRDERAAAEAHLDACPECSARLERLRALSAALNSLPPSAPSAGVFDRVLAGARHVAATPEIVARERMGQARSAGHERLREAHLPDMPDMPERRATRGVRRAVRRLPFGGALPTIAALLLITLTIGLLMRGTTALQVANPDSTQTASVPTGETLGATARAAHDLAAQLSFTPVTPTYLPPQTRLIGATTTTLADGARALDITWRLGDGLALHLREQPSSAPADGYAVRAAQMGGLAWQVDMSPPWRPMAFVERTGWVGVEQTHGAVRLLLDAQVAPSSATPDIANALRLTSLSLDAPYLTPGVPITPPAAGASLRSLATVSGVGAQVWIWDVTLSADSLHRSATITSRSGGVDVTEITYAGAGVRLDQTSRHFEIIPGPTPYSAPPTGVTEIAYAANTYLQSGKLWNLGVKNVTLQGGATARVYDLYHVDTARPEHVYADATTGSVVAIFVDTASSMAPGGAHSARPYVSTATCPPYTVTYTWLIYEPAGQQAAIFDTSPPKGWQPGAVPEPFACVG